MKAVIVCNGHIRDDDRCRKYIENCDLLVCADGGARHLKRWGVHPHVLMGDLDSISSEDYEELASSGAEVHRFPAEKDMTDTELAVRFAMDKGATSITVVGGLGTRFDHSLANVMLLKGMVEKGIRGCVTDGQNEVMLIKDRIQLLREPETHVTLLPFSECVEGVTTKGLYYPLSDATIPMGWTLGISNEFSEEQAEVSIKKGLLLVILARD